MTINNGSATFPFSLHGLLQESFTFTLPSFDFNQRSLSEFVAVLTSLRVYKKAE
jgi:hypothetical protein